VANETNKASAAINLDMTGSFQEDIGAHFIFECGRRHDGIHACVNRAGG
jgi:hypothetical protein